MWTRTRYRIPFHIPPKWVNNQLLAPFKYNKKTLILNYISALEIPNTETNELVGWRDPTEIPATPKPIKTRKTSPKNAMKYKKKPRFVVAVSEVNTTTVSNQIIHLNGVVCTDEEKAQRQYTHYICEQPNRGQNTFACIVSGKWLLHPNYVAESVKAGYFLEVSIHCFEQSHSINI